MLVFSNPGEIDLRSITILGVNVKEQPASIGQFGTGLKYAIAGILRLGGQITIWSGEKKLEFLTVPQIIRGKEFQLIEMFNSEELDRGIGGSVLGFTTELGKHWEPWMLYRELWSNAKDEGGGVFWTNKEEISNAKAGATEVWVECKELEEIHQNSGAFILDGPAEATAGQIEVRAERGVFYQGVKVGELLGAAKGYNILAHLDLTEDRTVKDMHDVQVLVAKGLQQLTNPQVIEECLKGSWEWRLDYDWSSVTPSEEFCQTVLEKVKARKALPSSIRDMLKRQKEQEYAQALVLPMSSLEEIEANEPPAGKEPSQYVAGLVYDLHEALKKETKRAEYWQKIARQLVGVKVVTGEEISVEAQIREREDDC